ncbi:hypothetical protein BIU96_14705 [Curtobacterium sp. MCBA15_008]|nr:hypothetical protein BIU96_14705 [Curtobacterium sp. MCBA15_008]
MVLRSVRDFTGRGRTVGFAVAGTVLDDGDVVVVATPTGSGMRTRAGQGQGPNGRIVAHDTWDGSYAEKTWDGDTVVRVHRWGERWSVWRWYDGADWTDRWYGNLETPWQRTPLGFDTQDWALDIVASGHPRTSSWHADFKDADELAWMVQRGTVSASDAAAVHTVGDQLMERTRRADWPFDANWDDWLPSSPARAVLMPAGWDRLEG